MLQPLRMMSLGDRLQDRRNRTRTKVL